MMTLDRFEIEISNRGNGYTVYDCETGERFTGDARAVAARVTASGREA